MSNRSARRADHIRIRPAAFVLLLFAGAAAGCAYTLVRGDSVNLAQSARIETGIEGLRELSFKTPVPVVVMDQDQAEQVLLDQIHRDYSDERMRIEGEAGAMIGLYPKGMDLKEQTLKLLKSQVAGFYEPHRKEMILVSGAVPIGFWNSMMEFVMQRDLVGEMLLAHELTHALQDQHFEVNKKLEALKYDDDREIALKSVAEGDATLAGLGYTIGRMDNASVDLLTSRLDELPAEFAKQTHGIPKPLSEPLIFQYTAGARFVAEAFHRGGWKAVDKLYANPPQSSQQIMHPAFYFDTPVLPGQVAILGYESAMPKWEKVETNTLGELMLKIMLQGSLGADAPETSLAERWAGDQMIILRNGDALTVLWLVAFRENQSAARFAATYGLALDRILRTDTPHQVDVRADAVLVMASAKPMNFSAIAPSIWKASKIAVRPMPPVAVRAGNEHALSAPAIAAHQVSESPRPSRSACARCQSSPA